MTDQTAPPTPTEQPGADPAAPVSGRRPVVAIGGYALATLALVVAIVATNHDDDSAPAPAASASPSSVLDQVEDTVTGALSTEDQAADSEPVFVEVDPASLPDPILSGALEDAQVDAEAFGTFARSTVAWVCGWGDRSAVATFDRYGDAGMQVLADQTVLDSRPLAELGYDENALTGVRHVAAAYAYRVDGGFQVDLSPRDGVTASAFVPASPTCS